LWGVPGVKPLDECGMWVQDSQWVLRGRLGASESVAHLSSRTAQVVQALDFSN